MMIHWINDTVPFSINHLMTEIIGNYQDAWICQRCRLSHTSFILMGTSYSLLMTLIPMECFIKFIYPQILA